MSWITQVIEFDLPRPRNGWRGRLDALMYAITGSGPYVVKIPHAFSVHMIGDAEIKVDNPQVIEGMIDNPDFENMNWELKQ